MTAPGVYTPSQAQPQEELVEVVARAICAGLEMDGVYVDDYRRSRLATAAINAIREWEGR